MTTLPINLHMMNKCFVGDSGCENMFFFGSLDLSSSDNYFTQRVDAANKDGIYPLAKCTTAMRMLAYGVAADVIDKYIKI